MKALDLLGSVLFSVACIPSAWTTVRTGRNSGTPLSTVWLLTVALGFYTAWSFLTFGFHFPFLSGVLEFVCWSIVLFYCYFPRCSACGLG